MIGADRAFAGILGEAAELGAAVQRQDRLGRERAEAHRRDVQHRAGIGLGALLVADGDAEVLGVLQRRRAHRMADELIAIGIGVQKRAERPLIRLVLGALIDQRALGPREGQLVGIGLEQVLTKFRPDGFDQETHMADHRVVARDGMALLDQVKDAQHAEGREDHRQEEAQRAIHRDQRDEQRAKDADRESAVAGNERKFQDGLHIGAPGDEFWGPMRAGEPIGLSRYGL